MDLLRNQFGVPQYPDDDVRKLFVLLAAIDLLERPTPAALADLTGHPRETIDNAVLRLREELGVSVRKVGDVYHLAGWGNLLKAQGVKRHLKGI